MRRIKRQTIGNFKATFWECSADEIELESEDFDLGTVTVYVTRSDLVEMLELMDSFKE